MSSLESYIFLGNLYKSNHLEINLLEFNFENISVGGKTPKCLHQPKLMPPTFCLVFYGL